MAFLFYRHTNPITNPTKTISHDGDLVNASKQNVPMVKPKFVTVFSNG